MKKYIVYGYILQLGTGINAESILININSMHAPFINCTTPNIPPALEHLLNSTEWFSSLTSYKTVVSTYKYHICLIVLAGGIYLWFKSPQSLKNYYRSWWP